MPLSTDVKPMMEKWQPSKEQYAAIKNRLAAGNGKRGNRKNKN